MRYIIISILLCALILIVGMGYYIGREKYSSYEIKAIVYNPKQEPHLSFYLTRPIRSQMIPRLILVLWSFSIQFSEKTVSIQESERIKNLVEALIKFPFSPNSSLSPDKTAILLSNTIPAGKGSFPNRSTTIYGRGLLRSYMRK